MKRVGNLYAQIAEPENLRLAFAKATKGKRENPGVVAYRAGLDANLAALRKSILSRNWSIGDYRFFTVYEPKERLICAAPFSERVLHHAIMNVCDPALERYAIDDSYACRKNKGLHRAVPRAQGFCRRHAWYLKLDIRKYFDSIDHATALRLLERRFKDADVLALFAAILATYETAPGKGLPIGNLVSQHLANFYLGGFDHWVKEQRRVGGYVRYMDDFVLWGAEKAALQGELALVRDYLGRELRLDLKDNVQLNCCARGLPFLGYRVYPAVIRLAPRSKRRFAQRLRQYEHRYLAGEWSEADLQRHMEPVTSFARFAESDGLRKTAIDRFGLVA